MAHLLLENGCEDLSGNSTLHDVAASTNSPLVVFFITRHLLDTEGKKRRRRLPQREAILKLSHLSSIIGRLQRVSVEAV